eukprot:3585122-Alexandrium_andersonii.AAC.1
MCERYRGIAAGRVPRTWARRAYLHLRLPRQSFCIARAVWERREETAGAESSAETRCGRHGGVAPSRVQGAGVRRTFIGA